jgi:hypothetical protein
MESGRAMAERENQEKGNQTDSQSGSCANMETAKREAMLRTSESICGSAAEGGQDTQDTGHARARTHLRTHLGHT